ncbi:restriction endonuclease [Mangrovibacterium marinum]|uniref:restriction endonuclease n=1 Tax=Mangrovibacterium marinum TaxID=1639118 RepID=UPI002A187EC9|nr:restriction endonuclease [Mangrovibacterium marinum]
MPIPDYQTIMLPLLEAAGDGNEYKIRELIQPIIDHFQLTETDKKTLLPSGTQPVIDNRVYWANTYLKKAGLLQSEKRGYVQITPLGLEVLNSNPPKIDNAFLRQFKAFQEFIGSSTGSSQDVTIPEEQSSQTPEEALQNAWKSLNTTLAADLLQKIKSVDASRFEQLVVDLLLAMGYGGSRQEAGNTVGKSGDGGIDGIINEDRLGLDKIYIQAKRWENTVPIKEVRDFAGALLAQKATKGVFITTSDYPKSAYDYVKSIDRTIVLVDGIRLAELMIEFRMGVSVKETYQVKEIDTDYFEA